MEKHVVTDRVLVLGLDGVYREDIKRQESSVLLSCARAVAKALGVDAAAGPIEGYYAESRKLSEYFRLVKALQTASVHRRSEVENMPEFGRLIKLFSSRLFGHSVVHNGVLPTGHDCLAEAMQNSIGLWEMSGLLSACATAALKADDYSIVGLASRLKDGVCLTAVRETVVLYAEVSLTGDDLDTILREPEYEWEVSEEISKNANRFIDEYNLQFGSKLPFAKSENAKVFFEAYNSNELEGRCVRIGTDIQSKPTRYYHWKIDRTQDGSLTASDFWSEELWTTERYRTSRKAKGKQGAS
jgi:hypothetical protein